MQESARYEDLLGGNLSVVLWSNREPVTTMFASTLECRLHLATNCDRPFLFQVWRIDSVI